MLQESCGKKDLLDLYKNEEISNLKRIFSSKGYVIKPDSALNRMNTNKLIKACLNSPKPTLNKSKSKNSNLTFKNKTNSKLSKVKFNGNLYPGNDLNQILSPKKQNTPFTPKKNNYLKKDTISLKKESLTLQILRNNDSKENIKKTSNNKLFIDNFEKIKEITKEFNYLAYNDAQLKYEYKNDNNLLSSSNLNKKSSKKIQSKNLSQEISKLTKNSKTLLKD